MSLPAIPVDRGWTFEDLQQIDDENWRRYEIVDGALVVSPYASPRHEFVGARLRRELDPYIPAGFELLGPLTVDLRPSYRIPDLLVLSKEAVLRNDPLIPPADLLLAVEVVSPSSVSTDRLVKPAQYAAAGIPAYWRVETDPVSLTAYALRDKVYIELGTWTPGQIAEIAEPFPVRITVADLVPREAP